MLIVLPAAAPYCSRSHPEEVRKFYSLVDEFHRMWDVVTDFDSLSSLATHMLPVRGAGEGGGRGGSRGHWQVEGEKPHEAGRGKYIRPVC